jgi:lipopolysaccharide transport system permease protein
LPRERRRASHERSDTARPATAACENIVERAAVSFLASDRVLEPPSTVGGAEEPPLHVLEPVHGWMRISFADLWHYRDLLYFLTWREVAVRYKQTLLGFAWAIIQPLLAMVVFSVFLGKLAKVPSDGVPYPVFSYLGLLPWTYFSAALTRSSMSLVSNQNLLSKVYFPRLLIPMSGTLSALADFLIALVVLIGLMLWYHITPSASTIIMFPFLTILCSLAATGVGMWLAALNVQYRDVQHAIPFLIQVWMYATPVVYPASLVPAKWRLVYALNPLTGIIESFRDSALGRPIDWSTLIISSLVVIAFLVFGIWRFGRVERQFADIV